MFKQMGIVLALVLGITIAAAQPADRQMQKNRPGGQHMAMMQKLNLTDQQRDQMKQLRSDFQKKQIQTEAKIRMARLDLRDEITADNPDRGAIEKSIKTISSLQEQAKLDRVDHLFAVRNILTPDQRKIWKDSMMGGMREGRGRMQERMRQFHFRGDGPGPMHEERFGDNVPPPDQMGDEDLVDVE